MNLTLTSLFCCMIILISQAQQAQNNTYCGTDIHVSNMNQLRLQNQAWMDVALTDNSRSYVGTTYFVPVQLHIIRQTNGTGGIAAADVLEAFDRMNAYYIDASVHFYQCSALNYIDDNTYYNYDKSQKNDLDADYAVANVANIYVANTTTSGSTSICGHATFPGGIDLIIQSKSCMTNGSTLIHEMGHYLGLYHTHETAFGDESVNGSDCLVDGDLICDTPADPRLSTSNNLNQSGCLYYGSDLDENGSPYQPMTENFMSYSGKGCRINFTDGQRNKIHNTLLVSRAYLNCNNPQILDALFYVRSSSDCTTAKQFDFYNAANGNPLTHSWDFGDGSTPVINESPTHSYTNVGVYTVRHTVTDANGTDFFEQQVVVGAVAPPYVNDFEASDALDAFELSRTMKNAVSLSTAAASNSSQALLFEGTEGTAFFSPYFRTPTTLNAFDELFNPYFKSSARLCVDASNYSNLQLQFDKRQFLYSNNNFSNLCVTVNGNLVHPVLQVNNPAFDDAAFSTITIDLSAYDGQVFTIGFEGSHRYKADRSTSNSGTASFIDNISISGNSIIANSGALDGTTQVIRAFPNPASDWIHIAGIDITNPDIQVFNQLGQSVHAWVPTEKLADGQWRLNLYQLPAGVYYVCINETVQKFQKL